MSCYGFLFQLLTDFSDTKEVPVFFEVFKNVLLTDSHGLRRAVQEQPVLYYWQVGYNIIMQTDHNLYCGFFSVRILVIN